MADATAAQAIHTETSADPLRPVRAWLYLVAGLILVLVMVGGVTRLTHSGLSITTWKPISGVLPPMSLADWQAEFDGYRKIPEFIVDNPGMTLDEFKMIFWWEWTHRLLARAIGAVFLGGFLLFLFQRRLNWRLAPPLGLLFVLGGFQGLVGWWMVSSGLEVRTDVSQYRLAAHLGTALVLFLAIIWVARRLRPVDRRMMVPAGWFWSVGLLVALIYVQIIAGAFVAGTDAGFGYNTWPLMDGGFIPAGLGAMSPWWRNLFENALTVQFDHRMIAYAVTAYAAFLLWKGRLSPGFAGVHGWMPRLMLLILVQVGLGIATLLSVVSIPVAVAHQAMAFMLAGATVAYLADMSRAVR